MTIALIITIVIAAAVILAAIPQPTYPKRPQIMISRWCADPTTEIWKFCKDPEVDDFVDFPVDGHYRCYYERTAGKSPEHGTDCQSSSCREAADCTCTCHADE